CKASHSETRKQLWKGAV
ncbi:Bgt-51366, partial [Blumeria graminis f. sp. tritici]